MNSMPSPSRFSSACMPVHTRSTSFHVERAEHTIGAQQFRAPCVWYQFISGTRHRSGTHSAHFQSLTVDRQSLSEGLDHGLSHRRKFKFVAGSWALPNFSVIQPEGVISTEEHAPLTPTRRTSNAGTRSPRLQPSSSRRRRFAGRGDDDDTCESTEGGVEESDDRALGAEDLELRGLGDIFAELGMLGGIEEVGIQIEEPFSILPLEAMCDGAIAATNTEMLGAVESGVFEAEPPY